VVGGGPAGRALAAETAERGMRTLLVDPTPDAPWRVTYGCWVRELPAALPPSAVAAVVRGRAIALSPHDLGWDYAVLDVAGLRAHLDSRLERSGATVVAGRAVDVVVPGTVALADGSRIEAGIVVDAGGRRQPLRSASTQRHPAAEQTAYGVVVDESQAAALVAAGTALFMDWRRDHGEEGWPTFLYAVPLGGGSVLLEETSLARRPGLPLPVLLRRLLARLAHHRIAPRSTAPVERVVFPVDSPQHRTPGVLGFGAAAPLVHPASGFNLAATLGLAPAVADAVASHLPAGPHAALAAADATIWPAAARAVHRLRRVGLEALLRMPPDEVPAFFEVFLGLPERHRWAYLTGRDDLRGMALTMNALFARAGWRLRRQLVGPALRPPAPPVTDEVTTIG
jgi:lycopene beta-cyclase